MPQVLTNVVAAAQNTAPSASNFMSRRRRSNKRMVLPDAKYGNIQVAKFINIVMVQGKKSVAERIVYAALDEIKRVQPDSNPIDILSQAIEKVRPYMEVKSRRVGGANYQVPTEVRADRSYILAMRWLHNAMRGTSNQPTYKQLARELLDAAEERGNAFRKKEETHRMAASNKAYSHFRF